LIRINYLRKVKGLLLIKRLKLLTLVLLLVFSHSHASIITNATISHTPRVNIPYAWIKSPEPYPTQMAIFWFGRVDRTSNYSDVRIIYDEEYLTISLHIFDRLLFFDNNPQPTNLTDWDAVSLFLHTSQNPEVYPNDNSHRFLAQLNFSGPRENYQTAYRGDGGVWSIYPTIFNTTSGWRGNYPNNDQDDRGWFVKFQIPFSSLGFAPPPDQGTIWRLALIVHDRDDAVGTPIPDTIWPENMLENSPITWGEIHFDFPIYQPAIAIPLGNKTIRNGRDGDIVQDGQVGGYTICGQDYWPDFFNGWGDANYFEYAFINIQNQWDVADWPCFSKYYITFPLGSIPDGSIIVSAVLTLHLFGGSWGSDIEPSWIQVLTIREDWDKDNLTWNNAPLAHENITGTWVESISEFPGFPGIPYTWDISRAAAQAFYNKEPLRLVIYSADGGYHSGKYFSSSYAGEPNNIARPTLNVIWGISTDILSQNYLPVIIR
jgi:hypothetical protein